MDKYQLDTKANRAFLTGLQNELLAFGTGFPSPCGASYYLGGDGKPMLERNLETWITCRMAHVYAIGEGLGFTGSEELIDQAVRGLRTTLHDDVNGGWYPGVTPELIPLPEKQCYGHAFVILAAASACLAGRPGAEELLKAATDLFLEKFWDDETGLSVDTWDTGFTRLEPYRGMNANMHSVEAFLAVADVTGEEIWRQRAERIIAHVLDWAEHNDWRIPEHFTENWEPALEYNADKPDDPFKPYGATPGHGIEWGRLITQWALSTFHEDPEQAKPYIEKACHLYERAVADGWCADGEPGIVYTTDWEGKPVVSDRMHWTLAEAINTSAVLYHVTGKKKYADDYAGFMQYLDEVVHDPVNGSWYHQLDEHNKFKETVWPGKSDVYHALQSMLIPKLDPSVSVAVAVKKNLWLDSNDCIKHDVVALGELLIDFIGSGDSDAGNPLFEANPGGAPCNVLAMLQKLGKKTAFIGKVGNDGFGRQLYDAVESCGVDLSGLMMDDAVHTTLAFVHKLENGDRDFSFYRSPGADMMLTADEVNEELIKNARIFHFGSLSLTDEPVRSATHKALQIAEENGVLRSYDPNLRPPLWASDELAREQILWGMAHCDFLKIADNEIRWLSGKEDFDEGIAWLRERFDIRLICLTLGPDGSRVYYGDDRIEVPAFLQDNTIETTGAGDTFCACMLNGLLETGLDHFTPAGLRDTVRFANAAASIITTRKGALKAMPEKEEVERFLQSVS